MEKIINELAVFINGDNVKKSILFVHGFPYDHLMWDNQVSELKNNYRCITYDIRGLGESPSGDGQFTIESFVDDIETIINELKLHKPVLCGLSMGGYIALRAVERMEEMFSGLILCDTKSEADGNEVKLRRSVGIKKINKEGIKKFVSEFVPTCFSKESINNLKEYPVVLNRALGSDPTGVKGCLLAMAGRTDTTGYLEQIKIPVLVICGEKDSLSPPESMRELASKIKDSEFVLIPEAAHMTPVENSKAVNSAIINYLNKINGNNESNYL